MTVQDPTTTRAGSARVPRSRGAVSGVLLVLLGVWGAGIPFVGPSFHFAFTPDTAWTWTNARGWLEVLPGAAAILAGLLMLVTTTRAVAVAAGWLASVAGAWFVLGPVLTPVLRTGNPGTPVGSSTGKQVAEQIAFFFGIGVVILFIGALALGRLSVRSVRDLRAALAAEEAERHRAAEAAAQREAAAQAARPETPQRYPDMPPTDIPAGATGARATDRLGDDRLRDDRLRDDRLGDDRGVPEGERTMVAEPGRESGASSLDGEAGRTQVMSTGGEHSVDAAGEPAVDPHTGQWQPTHDVSDRDSAEATRQVRTER